MRLFPFAAACLTVVLALATGPAAAQLLPCPQVPRFEGPGDVNYDICVGQGNLPAGDAQTHTGLTFVVPHVLEKSGAINPTTTTFDTTVFASYAGGLADAPPTSGAGVQIFLFGRDDPAAAEAALQTVRGADPDYRALVVRYGEFGLRNTALAVAIVFAPQEDDEDLRALLAPVALVAMQREREARERFEQTPDYRALDTQRRQLRAQRDTLDTALAGRGDDPRFKSLHDERNTIIQQLKDLDAQQRAAFEKFAPEVVELYAAGNKLAAKAAFASNPDPDADDDLEEANPLQPFLDTLDRDQASRPGSIQSIVDDIAPVLQLS